MMKKRQKLKQTYAKQSDNSSSGDETELFVRKKTPKHEIPTVDKLVEDGDTLQSLAIRYHCTIEDLKRLNNLHKDNEMFAKRTIKVPYRPFSTALAGVHQSGRSSPEDTKNSNNKIDCEILEVKLNENLEKFQTNEVNTIIFNSSIIPKDNNVEQVEVIDDEFAEEIQLLPQEEYRGVETIISRFNCSGVDGDISLKALILCIIIVIFAVPLIYVFYIAEHLEQYHHHQHQHHHGSNHSS